MAYQGTVNELPCSGAERQITLSARGFNPATSRLLAQRSNHQATCQTSKPNPLSFKKNIVSLYLPLLFPFKWAQNLSKFRCYNCHKNFCYVELSGLLHCSELLTHLNMWPDTNLSYILVEKFLSINSTWGSLVGRCYYNILRSCPQKHYSKYSSILQSCLKKHFSKY